MSVINKMLQDLDRRHAAPEGADAAQPHVQAVAREAPGREWFWRTLAVLIVVALAWVGWVAYQIMPRPIVTDLAYKSAEEAQARAALVQPPVNPAAPAPVAPEPPAPTPPAATTEASPSLPAAAGAAAPAPETAAQEAPPAPPPAPETFRLAKSIETPIVEPRVKPAGKPVPNKVALAVEPDKDQKAGKDAPKVERRDRISTPTERAENEFRYAAAVLRLGRASEAEVHFGKALEIDPGHRGARQALAAMRIERGELDSASELLEEGLRLAPGQPEFATALARIRIERNDLPGALQALDGAAAGAADAPEYQLLRASVLQRLGRHGEAAQAYRAALRQQSAVPQAWVGLGISLEALHQRREASDAFQQALAAGPLNPDVKAFAEQRVRALR